MALGLLVLMSGSQERSWAADPMSVELTTYDDGWSCPADCDAHVVFSDLHNGTRNAFLPAAGADPFANRASAAQCAEGKECAICFEENAESCIVAIYRGNGPPKGRVDATPAFMKEWCDKASQPAAVAKECKRLKANAAKFSGRINCIAEPGRAECRSKMEAAAAAKAADLPEFRKCEQLGRKKYNQQQPELSLERSANAGCAYFENQKKTNSNGVSWQMLSPGACRGSFFVGPNGTDCCSKDPMQAAVDFIECKFFYPEP
jgi:hypothetical protein